MKLLESAPKRYDAGIWLLTLGAIRDVGKRLAERIEGDQRVLDIGCGTGRLAILAAQRGACVKAIDINAHMLEIAHQRAEAARVADRIAFVEQGVAELDGEPDESYDAVTCGLCLSELSRDEIRFTLKHVARILKRGGLFLIADEVPPRWRAARVLHSLIRLPLLAVTYLITQQTTRPVPHLTERLANAGFAIVAERSGWRGSLCSVVARKP